MGKRYGKDNQPTGAAVVTGSAKFLANKGIVLTNFWRG